MSPIVAAIVFNAFHSTGAVGCLIGIAIAYCGWQSQLIRLAAFAIVAVSSLLPAAESLSMIPGDGVATSGGVVEMAATDCHTPIPLDRPAMLRDPAALMRCEELLLKRQNLERDVVRLRPADSASNCHGWIFAGGLGHLRGAMLPVILRENGYERIEKPRPGDLVIYRIDHDIAHSGIVRSARPGEPVMVESKWESLSVFLHPLDKSIYGCDCTFYRTERGSHLLIHGSMP